jgi:sugar phosphate isomerase/epimerase
MGNTLQAGVCPIESLKKYKNRYRTIHMKPFSKSKGHIAKIGEDDINWTEAVNYCKAHGNTEYFIVEYEEADAATGIKICLDNLKKYL